jgi:hypothetical protein
MLKINILYLTSPQPHLLLQNPKILRFPLLLGSHSAVAKAEQQLGLSLRCGFFLCPRTVGERPGLAYSSMLCDWHFEAASSIEIEKLEFSARIACPGSQDR